MMSDESIENQNLSVQFSMAVNKIYPRRNIILSGFFSGVLTVVLAFGGLLQLGYIDQLGGIGIADLSNIEAFAVFVFGTSVAVGTTAYVMFGLLAPEGMKTAAPTVSNPLVYIVAIIGQTVVLVVVYTAVTYLGRLLPILGMIIAAAFFILRYSMSNYVGPIAGNANRIKLFSRLFLVLPVIVLALLFLLGRFPDLTYNQWSVVLMYCAVGVISISGPIDMVNNSQDETIRQFANILVRRESAARRRSEICSMTPENLSIHLPEIPEVESINDVSVTFEHLEEIETWLTVYESYVSDYARLNSLIEGDMRQKAATSQPTHIDTVVATFTEQLHPRHYDSPESATNAANTFSTIVDSHENKYLTKTDQLPDRSTLEPLLEAPGPQDDKLHTIRRLFEPVQSI